MNGGKRISPCSGCPWRRTTPRGGFPGGGIDVEGLVQSCREDAQPFETTAMQCHLTEDTTPRICVGFALAHPYAASLRLPILVGLVVPDAYVADAPLRTLQEVIFDLGLTPLAATETP